MSVSASFKRDVSSVAGIMEMVDTFCTSHDLGPGLRLPVALALEEIFTNLVKYNAESTSDIGVSLALQNNELTVSVTDTERRPFDITTLPDVDVTLPIEQRTPGGLGIHLIRKMMDKIEYAHRDGESTITLHKRLA